MAAGPMMSLERRRLVDQLIRHEGLRLKVYTDSLGVPTIGVGRNIRDKGISHAEAMLLLDHDLDEVITDLAGAFPWFCELDPVRQRVVCDMRFNLGPTRFRRFKTMIRALGQKDYVGAAGAMRDSLWAIQTKSRAARLIQMMVTGLDDEP